MLVRYDRLSGRVVPLRASIIDNMEPLCALLGRRTMRRRADDPELEWRTAPDGEMLCMSMDDEQDMELILCCMFASLDSRRRDAVEEAANIHLPLLRESIRFWHRSLRHARRARMLSAAADVASFGIFIIDQNGRVAFSNRCGEDMLEQGDGLRRAGTSISATNMRDSIRLTLAIEQILSHPEEVDTLSDGGEHALFLSIARGENRPLVMVVAGCAFEGQRAAIVYVLRSGTEIGRMIAPICGLYALSPMETELVRRLVEGMTITDAAQAMRIKLHTARGYLKQIFDKTETTRQTDLVRVMMGSIIRLHPDIHVELVK